MTQLFAGLTNVTFQGDDTELGHGVTIRGTFAHLFAANIMAFAKPEKGQHHPGPWRSARGGYGYDIETEVAVPLDAKLPGNLDAEDTAWLIAALLRLYRYVYLMMPVFSDHSFGEAANSELEPILRPFEVEPRILTSVDDSLSIIGEAEVAWLRNAWPITAQLMKNSSDFALALRAADACTVKGQSASLLLVAWGALEQLFAPSRGELRFRISAHIATYLEPAGQSRLKMFKDVAKLYDQRCVAAHSAKLTDISALYQTFVILRNALVKMIDAQSVPDQAEFEQLLFCRDTP